MKAPLHRRLQDLEAKNDTTDDEVLEWGPGYEHFPPTTEGALRRMLQEIHASGAGRLPIMKRDAVLRRQAQGDESDQTPTGSCPGPAIEP